MLQPNSANRCRNPQDANWAAPFLFGRWPWDAPLFGAHVTGPAAGLVDATYAYGFRRFAACCRPTRSAATRRHYYSSGYNAGYGSGGLASTRFRDQGIRSYEFMITHTQSGPYSWWESVTAPARSPWLGSHPAGGRRIVAPRVGHREREQGAARQPVAQASDGTLIVGRGVPDSWLASGPAHLGHELPDGRRSAGPCRDQGWRSHGHVDGRRSGRPRPLPAPRFRRQHRVGDNGDGE